LEEVAKRKTAALMAASVTAGALAANACAPDLRRLAQYGTRLGVAFQWLDDVRDRDGLATVLDPEALRRKAVRLIERAKRSVAPFGRRAATLQALADWLAHASP